MTVQCHFRHPARYLFPDIELLVGRRREKKEKMLGEAIINVLDCLAGDIELDIQYVSHYHSVKLSSVNPKTLVSRHAILPPIS